MAVGRGAGRIRVAVLVLLLMTAASPGAALDLVSVVKKVEPAVVRIDTNKGVGSGVVIDDRGLVFTNYHVIADASKAKITFRSGETFEAQGFLEIDPARDLALLKIDKLAKPSALKIATALPETGQPVASFGSPRGFSFTASEGIVSAVRKGEEVRKIIGDAMYRELGYGGDATWVQSTAAISPGNSGGPLVNMNGEVIGLNTWTDTEGQNINFAISMQDMAAVLSKAKETVRKFAELPKRAAPINILDEKGAARDFKVALPSGRVFSFAVFSGVLVNPRREEGDVAVVTHPGGAPFAVAAHFKGVLNGATMAQYDNREPMMQVTYLDGKRHGLLKSWDQTGEPQLFAQYVKGKRHGYYCVFDEHDAWMLVDYAYEVPKWIQVFSGFRLLEGYKSRELAEKNAAARKLLARADKVEESLKASEIAFRKQVSDFEQEQRKARAVQLGPAKRDQIQARANARAAQDSAFVQELYRKFYGR